MHGLLIWIGRIAGVAGVLLCAVAFVARAANTWHVGGYPIGTLHTGDDERTTTESALRDAVSKELGDQADQADLRVSEGLAGRVIVETARQTHAQLIVLAASPGKPMLPGTVSQYVLHKADCPVMLVPSSSSAPPPADQPKGDVPR